MPSGISCIDAQATTTGVTVVMLNGFGFDMANSTLGVNSCVTNTTDQFILNGEQATFTVSCALTAGVRLQEDVNITYTNDDSGLEHVAVGRVVKTVQ